MAASDYGYYRSDGIQNSGTALRKNGNAYIYNKAGQIYPRQVTENFSFPEVGSTYVCNTLRSGYNLDGAKGSWRTDKAYQGYYKGNEGKSQQACGHFFSPNGLKPSVGGNNVLDFNITYVKITINREKGGYWSSDVTGHLRFSNLSSHYKNGIATRARWEDLDLNLVQSHDYPFHWKGYGKGNTVIEDRGGDLCRFIKDFLSNSSAQCLALFNGEDSPSPYSRGYASCSYFNLYFEGTRTVQL